MPKPQYAILRFAKYKGPGVHDIEAHNERRKEKYASNPDIDTGRSGLNFHLAEPAGRYRQEAERLIREAGCRTRKDSVRVVEVLVTASPEFFEGSQRPGSGSFSSGPWSSWASVRTPGPFSPPWYTWTRRRRTCISASCR